MPDPRRTESDAGPVVRHAVLTVAIFGPLLWAFLTVNNLYPIAVWSLFSETNALAKGRTFYVLKGETLAGDVREIRPIEITDGLTGRIHMMVHYVVENQSLRLRAPHPDNVRLLERAGGLGGVPSGARMPDLLRSWGESYNLRFPIGSPRRLRVMSLDACYWPGGEYVFDSTCVTPWRVEFQPPL